MASTGRDCNYIQTMRIKRDQRDNRSLTDELNRYMSSTEPEDISWLDVADYYTYLGQYDLSKSALEQYRNSYPEYEDEPAYHILIVLNDRLELLNKFFTAAISGNNELDRLVADRDMFLYTTRMTFL